MPCDGYCGTVFAARAKKDGIAASRKFFVMVNNCSGGTVNENNSGLGDNARGDHIDLDCFPRIKDPITGKVPIKSPSVVCRRQWRQ